MAERFTRRGFLRLGAAAVGTAITTAGLHRAVNDREELRKPGQYDPGHFLSVIADLGVIGLGMSIIAFAAGWRRQRKD